MERIEMILKKFGIPIQYILVNTFNKTVFSETKTFYFGAIAIFLTVCHT